MSDVPIQSKAISTLRPDNENFVMTATAMWNSWSRSPESLHHITTLFSDFSEKAGAGVAQPDPTRISGGGLETPLRADQDAYGKPRELFHALGHTERQRLYNTISSSMRDVPDSIVERQVAEFSRIDPAYAAGVLAAVMRAKRSADSEKPRRCVGLQPISHAAE